MVVEATNDFGGSVRPTLAALNNLQSKAAALSLSAVRVKDNRSGGYLSHFRGRGMEFDEARPYMAGDDLRTIHWGITARTGKPYTKLFREERDRPVLAWLDLRRPMMFATQGSYKAVRAAQTAALVGWTAIQNGDRFGGLVFDEGTPVEQRPGLGRRSQLRFLHHVVGSDAWDRSTGESADRSASGERALSDLKRVVRPGSLVFLLSDFRNLGPLAEPALRQIARHCDLVAVFFYDPIERELPPPGRYKVEVRGGAREIDASDSSAREQYRNAFEDRVHSLKELQRQTGFYLLECSTKQDPFSVLSQRFGRSGLATS